ncbi:hypothetical protein ACFFSY_17390 [Paenibacillus aurantiacus]|uniref:Methyl-accepting chemotaxis protein n=1 Tax=Paenibacillus aurantiacus TaxID=1936118 RepID=A0ABV5KR63_9BACL
MMNVKLSLKSSLIVTALMATSLGAVSFLGYYKAKGSLEQNFQVQANQQLAHVKNYIDIWIDGRRDLYKSLAEAEEMKTGDIPAILNYSARLGEMNQIPTSSHSLMRKDNCICQARKSMFRATPIFSRR